MGCCQPPADVPRPWSEGSAGRGLPRPAGTLSGSPPAAKLQHVNKRDFHAVKWFRMSVKPAYSASVVWSCAILDCAVPCGRSGTDYRGKTLLLPRHRLHTAAKQPPHCLLIQIKRLPSFLKWTSYKKYQKQLLQIHIYVYTVYIYIYG